MFSTCFLDNIRHHQSISRKQVNETDSEKKTPQHTATPRACVSPITKISIKARPMKLFCCLITKTQ